MQMGRFQPPSRQIVVYGQSTSTALTQFLKDFWVTQAVLVTNSSLAKRGGLADKVAAELGDTCVRRLEGLAANSPRADVVRVADALRSRGIEAVVALGGGSVVETVKAARICLTNNVGDTADLDRLKLSTTAASPRPYLVSIPTTLSAAEYTQYAGITDERTGVKDAFHHPDLAADAVVLDPEATMATPDALWFSTGLRALDHAVETWCSPVRAPYADATALYAARVLARALPRTKAEPGDLAARLDCQIGAWMSIQGATIGISHGASHGIGHGLSGVTGMSHGVTSCIMLPHVLRYNAEINADRQAALAEAMGQPDVPLTEIVAALVAELGLPSRLHDAGVQEGQLDAIADAALANPRVKANARPIPTKADMMRILQSAW
ncbi:iron-containing alcohol dehydrogenase [Pseudaminobacter sp. 19-2017]|uniref:Iron-containing alcohol dehydrogenase n=1 Tax=Pseudaminobacter soli (ex Zhang et al. 2022) TaxID=2831468 RepID=A0A942E6H6_9HYPH|nr:iron-containing alcohol dehydrogenase [Pseudaminobacter soli]MBS3652028.1 iron-containing alcohol dehydrogenase [Pseudaminobacter soli]